MADADPPPPLNPDECREPTLQDLVNLSRALNEAGARYLVVGGFAIRAAGYIRSTMDLDLLKFVVPKRGPVVTCGELVEPARL